MPRRNETAEKAVTILATAWVVLCGAAASAFVIVNGSSTPGNSLLVFGGCCLAAVFLLWLVRDRNPLTPRASIFSWFRRSKPETEEYEPRRRRSSRSSADRPKPPTAESVRQIAEDVHNTWVPSRGSDRNRS